MTSDKEVKKRYSRIAVEYDKTRFGDLGGKILSSKQQKVLLKYLEDMPKNAKILEVGCGSGRFLEFLEKKGYKNLYGIDSSKEMLMIAKTKTRAKLIKGDAYKLPFSKNSFDVIFSVHVLMHISNPKRALNEMLRVAKNKIIFDITNKNSVSYVLSKIWKGYKPRFSSIKDIRKMIPAYYPIRFKPTYMFPIKGYFSPVYYALILPAEKLAYLLQLKRFASQLFIEVKKS